MKYNLMKMINITHGNYSQFHVTHILYLELIDQIDLHSCYRVKQYISYFRYIAILS